MYTIIHDDCLNYLRGLQDKSIDLIVTDPPYGIGADSKAAKQGGQRYGKALAKKSNYISTNWDTTIPVREIFQEMFRVSKNQVIFGGNYFTALLPPSRCWLVWDKKTEDKFTNNFADCELAWTSFDRPARVIRFLWHGMIQQDMKHKEKHYHPTQKPIPVMKWILDSCASPDDLILDPFMGSGSTLIAAVRNGNNCIGIKQNADYVEIARARLAAQ